MLIRWMACCFELGRSPTLPTATWSRLFGRMSKSDGYCPCGGKLFEFEKKTWWEFIFWRFDELACSSGSSVFDGRCLIFGISTELLAQSRQDVLQFQSVDGWKTSWKDVEDLVTSVYFILESKRVDRSKLNQSQHEKMPLLMAPFERKNSNGIDVDSRSFRKKLQGRLKKHIGDLCLLAGLPQEALTAYNSALENLRLSQDHLWVASCLESLCAVTSIYKLDPATSSEENSPILKLCLETPSDIFDKDRLICYE